MMDDSEHDPPMAPLVLEDPRFRLRPVEAKDRLALATILAEPAVAEWWVHDDVASTVAGLFEDDGEVRLVIEINGETIGLIQFSEESAADYRHAGIDLFLATAWQGQGIGPDAIRRVARHLFEDRGHHRLTIDPALANERAIRAYERVGFRRVGIMRRYERAADGTWHDGLLMELLRGELRD